MFLRELTIRNLRALEDVRLSFEQPNGSTRKWTLILGENGCGKSTVLRAAALLLVGSDSIQAMIGSDISSWVRYEAEEATVSAILMTADGQQRTMVLRLPRHGSLSHLFQINRKTFQELDSISRDGDQNYLTMGYGASRRLNTDPDLVFKGRGRISSRARAIATLFSPEAVLEPLETWVIDMDYRGKRRQGQRLVEQIADGLMPEVAFHGIDKEHKQLLFDTPDGVTPLTQLSDGYQNVAAWCGDLVRSITLALPSSRNPLEAHGLVLVDEIDLHLHPVWQRRLRSFLDRSFPNLQFIGTTHSPLTVQQSGHGELYVMKRTQSNASPTIEAFDGAPNTMMVHQLLLSPLFNIDTMDSVEVQKKRKEYRRLKKKAKQTKEDKHRLKSLKSTLLGLPDIAQGLSKCQQKQTQVLEDIKKIIEAENGKHKQ